MTEEKPLYVVQQNRMRAVLPEVLLVILLGTLFYLGILVNISLLQLSGKEETMVKSSALMLLLLLILIDFFLSFRRARVPYLFFRDGIAFRTQKLNYVDITHTASQQNLVDKLFHTYSIPLTSRFSLRHIPQDLELQNYLQQLILYAQRATPPSPHMLQTPLP